MYTIIIFLPLYSFFTILFFNKWLGHRGSSILSCTLLLLGVLITLYLFYEVILCKTIVICKYDLSWISINSLHITWGLLFDTLSVSMLFIIMIISTLVHIYSISYMGNDPYLEYFLSFLSLFTFFMLVLVTADNFIQMFIGWEGVGFVSFLLISFWFTRVQAVKSSIKAVLMNRIGDVALLLSFIILYLYIGCFEYSNVFLLSDFLDNSKIYFMFFNFNFLDIFLFLITIGCVAKSAQIGLHTWLPDAMEGPTPVSALLHAATMVTAGVYLIIRCSPLLIYSPTISIFIAIWGAITAIMAASIAMFQDDIKKIIAYSTCSQLGYMFFSCGLWNFEISFFHLINHAFFKALLFLSAGSIIHSLNDEQDLKKMGGMLNLMPFTYSVLVVASLAIMGFPYLTGFYSKDVLLELIWVNNKSHINLFCLLIGLVTAIFTNIYSIRLLYLVFFANIKSNRSLIKNIHDSPLLMLIPQVILAFFSIFIGFFFSDLYIGIGTDIWNGSVAVTVNNSFIVDAEFLYFVLKQLPFILLLLLVINIYIYLVIVNNNKIFLFDKFRKTYYYKKDIITFHVNINWYLYKFLAKRWFFDIFYNFVSLKILNFSYNFIFKIFERGVLEYLGPLGVVNVTYTVYNSYIVNFNSGLIYHYSYLLIITFVFILSICFL